MRRIKLLLTICGIFGLTYFSQKKFATITSAIIKLTIAIVYIISAYYYITVLNFDTSVRMLRIIDIVIGLVCFVLKWILYYMKRKKAEYVILKVIAYKKFPLILLLTFS